MKKTITPLSITLLAGSLLSAPAIEAKTLYRLKILDTVANPPNTDTYISIGLAINDNDFVAGSIISYYPDSLTYKSIRGFVSNLDGTIRALESLQALLYVSTTASALNANGQIAGDSYVQDSAGYWHHAFLTDADGAMLDLGTLGGWESKARAINDNGQVTGYSDVNKTNFAKHAFLATANGSMIDLGTLGGSSSYGYAINNSGQVTGKSYDGSSFDRAFITDANGLNMRGLVSGRNASTGYAINSKGQVAGQLNQHAFVTDSNGTDPRQLLGLDDTKSSATGINDAGIVVGTYTHKSLGDRSFITDSNGKAQDLNNLVLADASAACITLVANDINNNGKITGTCGSDRTRTAIILTPEEVASVPPDKKNSLKLTESLQDLLDCDQQQNCNVSTAATGSYSLTLKLNADTLSSHGVDLSQFQTDTRIAFRAGKYAFSGTLADADADKKQQTPTSLPATWTSQHSECKKYAQDNSCQQSKTVVDGSVRIATDKKQNLTISLKGKKSTVNASAFGQQLFADLCPTASAGRSQVVDEAMFSIGSEVLPMAIKIDCKVKQRSKTVAKNSSPFILNSISIKAVLTAEP